MVYRVWHQPSSVGGRKQGSRAVPAVDDERVVRAEMFVHASPHLQRLIQLLREDRRFALGKGSFDSHRRVYSAH